MTTPAPVVVGKTFMFIREVQVLFVVKVIKVCASTFETVGSSVKNTHLNNFSLKTSLVFTMLLV